MWPTVLVMMLGWLSTIERADFLVIMIMFRGDRFVRLCRSVCYMIPVLVLRLGILASGMLLLSRTIMSGTLLRGLRLVVWVLV